LIFVALFDSRSTKAGSGPSWFAELGLIMELRIHALPEAMQALSGYDKDVVETHADVAVKVLLSHPSAAMKIVLIKGGKDNIQLPHYHAEGFDFFVVIQGRARVHVVPVINGEASDGSWSHVELVPGDCYSIQPGLGHCIQNFSEEDLIVVNVSPHEHASSDYITLDTTVPERLMAA